MGGEGGRAKEVTKAEREKMRRRREMEEDGKKEQERKIDRRQKRLKATRNGEE